MLAAPSLRGGRAKTWSRAIRARSESHVAVMASNFRRSGCRTWAHCVSSFVPIRTAGRCSTCARRAIGATGTVRCSAGCDRARTSGVRLGVVIKHRLKDAWTTAIGIDVGELGNADR